MYPYHVADIERIVNEGAVDGIVRWHRLYEVIRTGGLLSRPSNWTFDNVTGGDRTLLIPVCLLDSTFYLLRCQCGTTGDHPSVQITIKSTLPTSLDENSARLRYIEKYLQPFIEDLYVRVWLFSKPVFIVSSVVLCDDAYREQYAYDGGAHVMASAAEIIFGMPTFDRSPWETEGSVPTRDKGTQWIPADIPALRFGFLIGMLQWAEERQSYILESHNSSMSQEYTEALPCGSMDTVTPQQAHSPAVHNPTIKQSLRTPSSVDSSKGSLSSCTRSGTRRQLPIPSFALRSSSSDEEDSEREKSGACGGADTAACIGGITHDTLLHDLHSGRWTGAEEWQIRAYLQQAHPDELSEALHVRMLWEACSEREDNFTRADHVVEDADEVEERMVQIEKNVQVHTARYNRLKIDVMNAVKTKLLKLTDTNIRKNNVHAGIQKCLDDPYIFERAAKGHTCGATAIDRVLVHTQNGFRGVMARERRALVPDLAEKVLQNPDIPTIEEVSSWVPLHTFANMSQHLQSSLQADSQHDADFNSAVQVLNSLHTVITSAATATSLEDADFHAAVQVFHLCPLCLCPPKIISTSPDKF